MLEGEIPSDDFPDPQYTKRFYRAIQNFAAASLQLCEVGKTTKLDVYLQVALKLFREGNETVKNAVINVYLFTISHALDKQLQLVQHIQKFFPKELMSEYNRLHYASGMWGW